MNSNLLLLAAAASFAFASCTQEKKTETTDTTAVPGSATQTTTTTTTTVDTTAYRASADQLADRVAADLRTSDAAAKARLQQIYYNRGRALRDIDSRYIADTTGRYAAVKAANDRTTTEVKTVVTDPTAYRTYTDNQGNYYAGPYTTTATTTTTTTTTARPVAHTSVGQGSGVKKVENKDDSHKVKYENGAKIKRHDDGSVKIKEANGTKIIIDKNGHRTVKKSIL
ncbi:hypothetical protein [Hymenobacter sp. BRD67]|uniref:hypothetical protein n=1 Tax=Hymenobacter sp. BRD67 TaxID=2675877 RepID=UPI00156612A3|nr:hypothetical protein [Hymenobacter sp. BRD67]QKG54232.1 hypothetical protein GKZ67_18560 [Hymenobacter sp. BRD67]